MSNEQTKRGSWEHFLLRAAREISLSEAQYEKIEGRYSQLEKIVNASENPLLAEAHIFVQGSMRLKTTIKPVPGAPPGGHPKCPTYGHPNCSTRLGVT